MNQKIHECVVTKILKVVWSCCQELRAFYFLPNTSTEYFQMGMYYVSV